MHAWEALRRVSRSILFDRFKGADGGRGGFAAGSGFEIGRDAALRFEFGREFHDAAPRKRPEPRAGKRRVLRGPEVEVDKVHEMRVYPAKRVDETLRNADGLDADPVVRPLDNRLAVPPAPRE